jgi:hypothetical protein
MVISTTRPLLRSSAHKAESQKVWNNPIRRATLPVKICGFRTDRRCPITAATNAIAMAAPATTNIQIFNRRDPIWVIVPLVLSLLKLLLELLLELLLLLLDEEESLLLLASFRALHLS